MIAVQLIFFVIMAYLLGSIPSSVWVGKWFYGIDVREEGSGNAGATNTIRVLGWKAGVPVLLFDVFKGWLAVSLIHYIPPYWLEPRYMEYYKICLAIAAVVGHIFPIFAGFRGGKGVATLLGVGFGLYGFMVGFPIGLFTIVLLSSEYVSIASITAAILFPVCVYYVGDVSTPLLILSILVAIFVPLTHRKNIIRLFKGQENKVSIWKKR